eukprot:5384694-Prorocentrum_lima.AAC.1
MLGMHRHPGCAGDLHSWDINFRRVVYHADHYTFCRQPFAHIHLWQEQPPPHEPPPTLDAPDDATMLSALATFVP